MARRAASTQAKTRQKAPGETDRRRVLVLQGGGALGSYQAGVFEALQHGDYEPDWVAGISIGAINAALICGNPPERRVERLRAFWERITSPVHVGMLPDAVRAFWEGQLGAWRAAALGQPGFFHPRAPADWLDGSTPTSYYDIAPLRRTLEEFVDFDLLNDNGIRLSVGATRIDTGTMVYFDTARTRIGPDHIMASGALPPGLPPVTIDGVAYWDGGLVSNTPLQYILAQTPRSDSLIFQVDLFPAEGEPPRSINETLERAKDIRYASHSRAAAVAEGERHNLRTLAADLLDHLPDTLAENGLIGRLRAAACPTRMDVMHLVYRPERPLGADKDYQFDRFSAKTRWQTGHRDAANALAAAPWRAPHEPGVGFRRFDLVDGQEPERS